MLMAISFHVKSNHKQVGLHVYVVWQYNVDCRFVIYDRMTKGMSNLKKNGQQVNTGANQKKSLILGQLPTQVMRRILGQLLTQVTRRILG